MIRLLIEFLQSDEWLNTNSQWIEIAKGKRELATSFKDGKKKLRRQWQSKR